MHYKKMEILFWGRSRGSDKITIYVRITIDGIRAEFSSGIGCAKEYWLGNEKLIKEVLPYHYELNTELEDIRAGLRKCFNRLRLKDKDVTSESVKEAFLGKKNSKPKPEKTIKVLTDWFQKRKLQEFKSGEIVKDTYKRYVRLSNFFCNWYLQHHGTKTKKLNEDTIKEYLRYLKIEKKHKPTYINKHLDTLRGLSALAQMKGFIKTDEMRLIKKLPEPDPDTTHLKPEEVRRIESLKLTKRMDRIRDQLIMLTEIGTHLADYKRCKTGEIYLDEDGDSWLFETRQKTKAPIRILLSEKALSIIHKYGGLQNLPCITDQRFNDYIKVLGERAEIDKVMSSKIGRKTFANDKKNIKHLDDDAVAKMMALKSNRHLKHYVEMDLDSLKHHWKKAG